MAIHTRRWEWAILPPLFLLLAANSVPGARAAQAGNRISGPIDDAVTVSLPGHIRPEVSTATISGSAEQELPMEHMILTLKADPAQNAALAALIHDQQDPHSANYHRFLTPQQYGAQFGASSEDIAKITAWLKDHGFTVEEVPAGRRSIVFSGNAATVTSTFGTPIHKLTVGGETHYANTEEPRIPAALADVVGGFVKLNDFQHKPSIRRVQAVGKNAAAAPQFTYGGSHYLAPADYAAIYDLASLYSGNIDGSGQSIAIVARSNISMSDLETFRSQFGLPANDPTVIIASGTDPGFVSGDGDEATLDVQWSGAVAPKATVKLVIASSTATADGVDLSAQYIVNGNLAPVMSVSFGSCEGGMGAGGVAFYNALWQQAAAQGITVLVSSGDSGAAGCDSGSAATGSVRGVNGLCSSPYNVCVGGTEFAEGNNPGQYWLPGNNSTLGSAQGYIPETVWNESGSNGGSGLWAGGGGSSIYFTKPAWQTGIGVPPDGARDVPDVALTAAGHDGYLIEEYGEMYVIAGTSAASPSFAGMMALVNQKIGARLGNPNPALYTLASLQAAGGAPVFHDTTAGSNTVPGVTGFSATVGYDQASGLGSVDAAVMVNHWTDASTANSPTLSVGNSPTTLSLATGGTATFGTNITVGGSFKSAVALAVSGAPAGVTVTLSSATLASPGSGSATVTVAASRTAAAGVYTLTVTATGGNLTARATTALTIVNPSFTMTPSAASLTVSAASTVAVPVSVIPSGGFNSTVALTASRLPAGVTASYAPATLSGAALGTSTLTFAAGQTAHAGTYSVLLTAAGGGLTKTAALNLTVVTPSFTLTDSGPSPTLSIGGAAKVPLTVSPSGNFNSTVSLSAAGLPSGVTPSFSPAAVSLSANRFSTLTLVAGPAAKPGTYVLTVTAAGGGLIETLPIVVTIPTPSFTLTSSASAVSIAPGGIARAQLSFIPGTGFASPVSLTALGLPAGVTAAFSPAKLSGTSAGVITVSFTAATTAGTGPASAIIKASGGGLLRTATVQLTVQPQTSFTLGLSNRSITVKAGGPAVALTMSLATAAAGFNSPVALMVAGTQPNITQTFAKSTLTAALPSTPLTVSAAANASPGTYTIWLAGYTDFLTQMAGLSVTVTR